MQKFWMRAVAGEVTCKKKLIYQRDYAHGCIESVHTQASANLDLTLGEVTCFRATRLSAWLRTGREVLANIELSATQRVRTLRH